MDWDNASASGKRTISFPLPAPSDSPAEPEGSSPEGRILYVTKSRYTSEWSSMVHTHTFTEVFFVTGGKGRVRWGKSTFPILQNDLVIVNPNILHAEFSQEEEPLEYIVIGLDGVTFSARYDEETPDCLYFIREAEQIGSYFRLLLQEMERREDFHAAVCRHLMSCILILLLSMQQMTAAPAASGYVPPFLVAAKDYIDTHFKDKLELETIAQAAGQNKFYLAHAFSEHYGISPMKYLMKRRIEAAKFLLSNTAMSIRDISGILRFSSTSHFAQVFRRMTGCAPKDYRKQTPSPDL